MAKKKMARGRSPPRPRTKSPAPFSPRKKKADSDDDSCSFSSEGSLDSEPAPPLSAFLPSLRGGLALFVLSALSAYAVQFHVLSSDPSPLAEALAGRGARAETGTCAGGAGSGTCPASPPALDPSLRPMGRVRFDRLADAALRMDRLGLGGEDYVMGADADAAAALGFGSEGAFALTAGAGDPRRLAASLEARSDEYFYDVASPITEWYQDAEGREIAASPGVAGGGKMKRAAGEIDEHGDDVEEGGGFNPATKKVQRALRPDFTGFAGKFVNLSPHTLILYWESPSGEGFEIATATAFQAVGTATFPGHAFYFAPEYDRSRRLQLYIMTADEPVHWYDPLKDDDRLYRSLTVPQREMYHLHLANMDYSRDYLVHSGRPYLGMFPVTQRPTHHMHIPQYFGQQLQVTTDETHFLRHPPDDPAMTQLTKQNYKERRKNNNTPLLPQYRAPDRLNLTLTVLSCRPRVFEIHNFLSPVEVEHILELTTGLRLRTSTTSGDHHHDRDVDRTNTRTSTNTWIHRPRTPLVDAVYRRAADVLGLDEALLRDRDRGERRDAPTRAGMAEALQLVHYGPQQEYTAHHDFSYPPAAHAHQPTRFATLLIYLNGATDGLVGGETAFPRWANLESHGALQVEPEAGKAVLFYSRLPDGNMDDLSQHAAYPIKEGEKWLANLWVWDPLME